MRGVLVEANPALLTDLCRFRAADKVLHLAITPEGGPTATLYVSNQDELSSLDRRFVTEWRDGAVGLRDAIVVPSLTLTALLEREFVARSPIFLSIDIEGMDLAVLQTLDWSRWRPAVIQTEPSDHHLPGNAGALAALLEGAGYAVVAQTDVNLVAIDAARAGLVTDPLSSGVAAIRASFLEQTNLVAELRHQVISMREDRDSRISVLTQRSEVERNISAALRQELAQVHQRVDEISEMLAVVRTVVRVREEQLADADVHNDGLRQALVQAEAQHAATDAWARTLEENSRLLHRKIDALHRSSSWRVTAPMRALAGWIKGERHRS
jgi:hypothetical protein